MSEPQDPLAMSDEENDNGVGLYVLSDVSNCKNPNNEEDETDGNTDPSFGRIFTVEEKQLLLHLFNDYPILESKCVKTSTLAKKKRYWEELTLRFNAANLNTKRGTEQLRTCLRNIKSKSNAKFQREQARNNPDANRESEEMPKPPPKFFAEQEKQLLLKLLDEYPLLKSSCNKQSIREKRHQYWIEVTDRFNAASLHTGRTTHQLRILWKNLKAKFKKSNQEMDYGGEVLSKMAYLREDTSPTNMNVDVDPGVIDQSSESWEEEKNKQPSSKPKPANMSAVLEDRETAASNDSVWPASMKPNQKRKLDSLLDQDQQLINCQLNISKIEEEKNLLQLQILNEQLKNVKKEAELLDKKILLTDKQIEYWDKRAKNGGEHDSSDDL